MLEFIRKLRYFLPLFFLFTSSIAYGQEYSFLKGKVVDQKTEEPVIFATVIIKGRSKGIITNMDGSFRLPTRYKDANDSIQISSMGYEKKVVPLTELSSESLNIIYLTPGILELDEALVSAKKKREPTSKQIVRRAIARIPQNYPLNNFAVKGYYRDYQLDSFGYLNLNEALLEVFDAGFDEIDMLTSKVRMYDYVQNKSFRRDSLADDAYNYTDWRKIIENARLINRGGNEFEILRAHDAIRNYELNAFDFVNNLSERDILRNHGFFELDDVYSDEESLFAVRITRTEADFSARGKIFISKNDYAIHKFEYTVYDNSKVNSDPLLRKAGIYGQFVFEVSTEYKRGQDDKMFLNYISFQNRFRLAAPPKFAVKDVNILPDRGAFAVRFNNRLANVGTRFGNDIKRGVGKAKEYEKRWYNFKYKGEKIKFKNIKVSNDTTVYLFPKMDSIPLKTMMTELEAMSAGEMANALQIKINGLEDVNGNSLDVGAYRDYNQFREFFVQEVRPNTLAPKDSLFMDKRKPIFENQPMKKPDNFEDYWMNTPLKEKSN